MSSSTTRSGLIPTAKNHLKLVHRKTALNDRLPAKLEALPMTLTLRPFGGFVNPFAKQCSVLCNHPAPTAVKNVINHLRSTLASEAKSGSQQQYHQQHNEAFGNTHSCRLMQKQSLTDDANNDIIPEDLFRRYTDTDSRPLTPSPTVTSVRTRTSAGSFLNNRRCITPEFGKNEIIKRKKIILDLRRSHSQETLYWKPSSDLSQSNIDADSIIKPKSADASDERKTKRQKSEEQHSKPALTNNATNEENTNNDDVAMKKAKSSSPQTCINDHQMDDEDIRRGKKRKKIKPGPSANPTATFHLSEDPETQVAALGPDSLNPSTRPSLIPNALTSLLPNRDKRDSEPVLLKGSFLTDDAFQALKTELDVDTIENTFETYLNRALREAIRYIPIKDSMDGNCKKTELNDLEKHSISGALQSQTKMPRKFSKSATRFDVPLDTKSLESMTALEYLSRYVWVSRQRKQLYKRVFLKYVKESDDDICNTASSTAPATNFGATVNPLNFNPLHLDSARKPKSGTNDAGDESQSEKNLFGGFRDRTIPIDCLPKALEDALEFHGTKEKIERLLSILEHDKSQYKELNFRMWCGVVSFAERFALNDPTDEDSSDELEKADFNSLEQLMAHCRISKNLNSVFEVIRQTHNQRAQA